MLKFSKQKTDFAIETTRFAKKNNLTNLETKKLAKKFIESIKEKNPESLIKFSISELLNQIEQQHQQELI